MSHAVTASLMQSVRDSIERVELSLALAPEDRTLTRALAHLCSAYDELEMFARDASQCELLQPVQRSASGTSASRPLPIFSPQTTQMP
jgi:hypothetical protein